jgi:L-ascorbate metabolism protein UlaG (beta-lactamase superfamily)
VAIKSVVKKIIKVVLIIIAAEIIVGGLIAYSVSVRIGGEPPDFSSLSYYSSGRFVAPVNPDAIYRPLREEDKNAKRGIAGWLRFLSRSPNAPDFELKKVNIKGYEFPSTPEKYAVYWLGHSALILELDEVRLITDPVLGYASPFFLAGRRYDDPPIKLKDLPNVDVVLITHDHYDHLDYSAIRHLRKKRTIFIVPLGVGAHLKKWGVDKRKIIELGWGDSYEYKGISITAEKAAHWSGRYPSRNGKTLWVSYVVKGTEKKVFLSGDTGYGRHFKEIREKYGDFDLAAIEIDGWNPRWPSIHLFPDEVLAASKDLGAALLLPIHWGVYDLAYHKWDESIREVARLCNESGQKLISPLMGEKVNPDNLKEPPVVYWWMYQW